MSGTIQPAIAPSDRHSVYVWGQHISQAGRRAWPDEDDEDECMDDYVLYEGTADDFRDIAGSLAHDESDYSQRVARLLLGEIGESR